MQDRRWGDMCNSLARGGWQGYRAYGSLQAASLQHPRILDASKRYPR